MSARRLIVGISGSSGAIYGYRMLQELAGHDEVETHLVMSAAARRTIRDELDVDAEEVSALATHAWSIRDIGAALASGSFSTAGMIVAPCSIKTLSGIAHSYADNLLVRAADVTLKEQRRLVLLVRETPLHIGHLRLMSSAAEAGAVILPPLPAFYNRPRTIMDIVDHTVGRTLDLFAINHALTSEWTGDRAALMSKRGSAT